MDIKVLPEFKISCHSIGKIMAGEIGLTDKQHAKLAELEARELPGAKPLTENMKKELSGLKFKKENPELPQGAKTYCKEWLKRKWFNRKKEFKAIVIEKGLQVEPLTIKFLGVALGMDLQKNEDYFYNEYIHGSPDVLLPEIVRDVKSSWDLFTFPMFDDQIPDDDYWWQLQGYMIILGLKKAALDYVLIDTPMPLVLTDINKLRYQAGGTAEEWTLEKYEALYPNYRFDDIPAKMRIKTFEFNFEPSIEQAINERVIMCRKYIAELIADNG